MRSDFQNGSNDVSRIFLLLSCLLSMFRGYASVRLENLALRHQVMVYKQSISRPKLKPADRMLWVWLSRLWPGWQQTLEFVQFSIIIMSASQHEHKGYMMASSPSELEQRVSDLEAEMDKLKRKLDKLDSAKPWWEQITGTFEDDPKYDEAMK